MDSGVQVSYCQQNINPKSSVEILFTLLQCSARFGVHYVDFDDENRTRTPKESAIQLTKIFADNGFPTPSSSFTALPSQIVLIFCFTLFSLANIF